MDNTLDEMLEKEHLHSECDCQSQSHGQSHDQSADNKKEPRPPDDEEEDFYSDCDDSSTDGEDMDKIEKNGFIGNSPPLSPMRMLLQGQPIIPHFSHMSEQNELVKSGSSSVSLPPVPQALFPPNHQDLVWAGSSLGTMHKVPIRSIIGSHVFNDLQRVPSSTLSKNSHFSSRMSNATSVSECGTDGFSFCRICQMSGDDKDPLFSPCRCTGSLRNIHPSCLKKWIRISQRRGKKQPPRCEICHYQFTRHKRFKFSQWRWPRVKPRDKLLHIIFLLNLIIMVGCAIATVMCFLSDRGNAVKFPKNKVSLTTEEVITLTCGVTFFVAFFIAMTVEIKARHTLYKLFMRFITHNTEWTVEQYERSKDPLYKHLAPPSVV